MTAFALNSSCLTLSCSRCSCAYSPASGLFGCGLRPRFLGVTPASWPSSRSRRHVVRCDEYKPSRRSTSPTPPSAPDASASSVSWRMRSLYLATKALRFGRSGEVALSGSPERAASRTADAVPSPKGPVPFFLDMFDNVVTFLLALDCHFDQEGCLSHVGTEGQRLMGHADESTTLRYIELSMADIADEYRRATEEIQRRYQVRG